MGVGRAHELGLVNAVTPAGACLDGALKLAERIVVNAPLAVREAKKCMDEMVFMSDKEAFERSGQAMVSLSRTPDYREGPLAFIEKRAPRWTGKKQSKL